MTKSRNNTDRYRLIIGLLVLLCICSVETAAQGWYTCQEEVQHFHEHMRLLQSTPPTYCSKTREDPNHADEVASDTFFNKRLMSKVCFTLNGTYIGPQRHRYQLLFDEKEGDTHWTRETIHDKRHRSPQRLHHDKHARQPGKWQRANACHSQQGLLVCNQLRGPGQQDLPGHS